MAENANDQLNIGEEPIRSGQITEGELELARSVAKRMGWVEKEQWTREDSKWVDADLFLENTPDQIRQLRDRVKRQGQAAEVAMIEVRRQAQAEAEQKIREAVASGNQDAAVEAAKQAAQYNAPDVRLVEFYNRNPWMNTHPAAAALARTVGEELAKRQAPVDEQLDGAEAEVRKRYPELFPQAQARQEVERVAPQVAQGGRAATPRPRAKGWDDIPGGDKSQLEKFVRQMATKNIEKKAAQDRLATTYWANKE